MYRFYCICLHIFIRNSSRMVDLSACTFGPDLNIYTTLNEIAIKLCTFFFISSVDSLRLTFAALLLSQQLLDLFFFGVPP